MEAAQRRQQRDAQKRQRELERQNKEQSQISPCSFGYTEAGQALRSAREQSRRMVEQDQAASCNYEEPDRRHRANRFVIDAFNGRVDAILSRARHDNYGTLEQEIPMKQTRTTKELEATPHPVVLRLLTCDGHISFLRSLVHKQG
jgi:hypothetical protein